MLHKDVFRRIDILAVSFGNLKCCFLRVSLVLVPLGFSLVLTIFPLGMEPIRRLHYIYCRTRLCLLLFPCFNGKTFPSSRSGSSSDIRTSLSCLRSSTSKRSRVGSTRVKASWTAWVRPQWKECPQHGLRRHSTCRRRCKGPWNR